MERNLYFDNAATSFPKPREVEDAALRYLRRGGNYGRAAYARSVENVRVVEACRDAIAALIRKDSGSVSGDNIVFTKNATESANLVIRSLGLKGRKVLVSPLEHNAIMRPLADVGAVVEVLPCGVDGRVDVEAMSSYDFSDVALVIVNHVSNVNGVVQPVEKIASLLSEREVYFMIDASQSMGSGSMQIEETDFIVFTGHKSLLGPPGVGGLYFRDDKLITPLLYGGTGSNSDSYEMPNFAPDKFEAGTPNILGIEMLLAALNNKPEAMHTREEFELMLGEIKSIYGLKVFCAEDISCQGEVFGVVYNVGDFSLFSRKLYSDYGIETRNGLHCSPLAHRSIGSFDTGLVRFSLSPYHTSEDLHYLCDSLKRLCAEI